MSHVIGNFTVCALTLKSLPSGYNLDFQEVTPKLWESLQKVNESLNILSDLMRLCKPKEQTTESPTLKFSTLTELVKLLFQKHGVPFRTAHKIVGAFVRRLSEHGLTLKDATPEMLEETAEEIAGVPLKVSASDLKVVDVIGFVKTHNIRGGPSPTEVRRMLDSRKNLLTSMNAQVAEIEAKIANTYRELSELISKIVQSTTTKKFKNCGVKVWQGFWVKK